MPDPDQIAQLIADARSVRERTDALLGSMTDTQDRPCRAALGRAGIFLHRVLTSLSEAHDEATVSAFVETREAGALRA